MRNIVAQGPLSRSLAGQDRPVPVPQAALGGLCLGKRLAADRRRQMMGAREAQAHHFRGKIHARDIAAREERGLADPLKLDRRTPAGNRTLPDEIVKGGTGLPSAAPAKLLGIEADSIRRGPSISAS